MGLWTGMLGREHTHTFGQAKEFIDRRDTGEDAESFIPDDQ
jgi:hypothetical protein